MTMPSDEWSKFDHTMIACAKNRGMVTLDNGYVVMLVAWYPAPTSPKARVTYPSGKSARISAARVVGTIEDWSKVSP
jgi:hypothetical protein